MEFNRLYEISFKKLYRFFYYKGVKEADIEDLIQQCYIEIFSKYYKKGLSVDSVNIVYGYARNILMRWYENNKQTTNLDEETLESIASSGWEFEEDFEEKILPQIEKVKVAIESLNETTRQVIKLRFLDGLSRRETASSLGISEDQVHTIQKRGIEYLKAQLITY
ncbi:MAG: sigma-70 family RNA polymerase sigma factor [bacterium]